MEKLEPISRTKRNKTLSYNIAPNGVPIVLVQRQTPSLRRIKMQFEQAQQSWQCGDDSTSNQTKETINIDADELPTNVSVRNSRFRVEQKNP